MKVILLKRKERNMSEISLRFKVILNDQEVNLGEIVLNSEVVSEQVGSTPIELKLFSTKEVMEMLNTYAWKIDLLRKNGALKGIQMGKKYVYPYAEIKKFQENFIGMDLSNEQAIMESVHRVELIKIEQQLKFEKNQNKKSN